MPGDARRLCLWGGFVGRLRYVVALRVREQLLDVEPGDLTRDPTDEIIRRPAVVLATLVSVERLLELSESVPEVRGQDETQRLHGLLADEGYTRYSVFTFPVRTYVFTIAGNTWSV